MTTKTAPAAEPGIEVLIPLNKLKKSPHNARRTPHGDAAIAALAASIARSQQSDCGCRARAREPGDHRPTTALTAAIGLVLLWTFRLQVPLLVLLAGVRARPLAVR